jgi:hypothetical protein
LKKINFIKYIHGDQSPTWVIFVMHLLGLGFGFFYVWKITPHNYFDEVQKILFVLLSWDLIGGIVSTSNPYGKRFWATKPILEKEIYLLIHLLQPLVWYLFFGAELISCFFVVVTGLVSAYFLIKSKPTINVIVVPILLFASITAVVFDAGFSEYVLILPIAYLIKLAMFALKINQAGI